MNEKKRVVVAMSGGVDSAVAAALLCQQGYYVTGVTMKIWDGCKYPDVRRHGCYGPGEEANIEDARAVANTLKIPHIVIDLTTEFNNEILDYVKNEYSQGRTPNPCTRCNPRLKFGALARKVLSQGLPYDYFATGHYARIEYEPEKKRFLLKKARDRKKDQSYFLALLSQEQLAGTLFPLGQLLKSEVRDLALNFGLNVSRKADSQDFFTGDYNSFFGLSNPGPIINQNGVELGRHKGISFHTVGQRKGLGITSEKPMYVIKIDPGKNVVIVGERNQLFEDQFIASSLNWVGIDGIHNPLKVAAVIRSRHEEAGALVTPVEADRVHVKFNEPQMAVTPGQTVVFYDDDILLGGGVIEMVGDR